MKSFTLIVILLFSTLVSAHAQKLPNKQEVSVWAPSNIKIDGMATEWNNQFKAHNASADVLYAIANDDENLYLVMQAKDVNVINTIVGYGFEFEIQKSGKKEDKDKISISYPVISKNGFRLAFGGKNGLLTDTSTGAANTVMNNNNHTLEQKFKSIIVTGIRGLDTMSVYNDDGIKAAGRFDNKMVYTLEISIALKRIGFSADGVSKFAYHMIVNGYTPSSADSKVWVYMGDGTTRQVDGNTPEMQQAQMDANMKFVRRNPHTDFWGEYTLAKKP